LVLYRFGSTGVVQVLQAAAQVLNLVPVYPVRSISKLGGTSVFPDCVLVRKETTVGQVARMIMGDIPIAAIEGIGSVKVADDDIIDVGKNDILSFRVGGR
jgi:ribosome-binding ATPase YchF (GTP1/OBG family)